MFSLDYPAVNCRQCRENLAHDEIEPECETCAVDTWDSDIKRALSIYDKACIWGELDHGSINQAMDDMKIPAGKRRQYRQCVVEVHRLIKKDALNKTSCQQKQE